MIVGIDARCLEEEKISGVGEYVLELLKNIFEIDRANRYIIFSNSFREKKNNFSWCKRYSNVEVKKFHFPNKLLNFSIWYFGWPKVDRLIGKVDIFFAPNIAFLSVSQRCRLVVTFHDLSYERYPEFFAIKKKLWHFVINPSSLAKKADKIVAVSASTKEDLKNLYDLSEEKIKVIYHGVSGNYKILDRNNPKFLEIQKKYKLPYKFILCLGSIEPRKNIVSLIRAYEKLRDGEPKLAEYKLVIVGGYGWLYDDVVRISSESKYKDDIIFTGYVDRGDKVFIYNLASLFVYPSFFEGFGLPPLEAMACGVPVITSNCSSLPEVIGNSTIMIDPDRPDEITQAICAVLKDENLRNHLIKTGLERVKLFSWKKCAEETIKLFEEVSNLK